MNKSWVPMFHILQDDGPHGVFLIIPGPVPPSIHQHNETLVSATSLTLVHDLVLKAGWRFTLYFTLTPSRPVLQSVFYIATIQRQICWTTTRHWCLFGVSMCQINVESLAIVLIFCISYYFYFDYIKQWFCFIQQLELIHFFALNF